MNQAIVGQSRTAAGTINPFRFVQSGVTSPLADGSTVLLALQCTGAGVPIIGIASEWTDNIMGTQWQTTLIPQGYPAAAIGDKVGVYLDSSMDTLLMVGSGFIVEPDDLLISDASGNAKPFNPKSASSGINWVGARAIEGGFAGDVIRVQVYTRAVTIP